MNRVNGQLFPADIVSVTEGNRNTSLPVCAQLVSGGESGGNSSTNGLQRDTTLLITTIEGVAGKHSLCISVA